MNSDDEALLLKMGRDRRGIATLRRPMNKNHIAWREVAAAERLCRARLAFMQNEVTLRLTREGCALVRELRDRNLDQNEGRIRGRGYSGY